MGPPNHFGTAAMTTRRNLIQSAPLLGAALMACLTIGINPVAIADPSELTFWKDGDPGEKLNLRGRIVSTTGKPIPNARVAMRQADGATQYRPQYEGALFTAADGTFKLRSAVPGQYSSAKHIHVYIYAEGYEAIQSDILFKGDPNINLGTDGGYEVLLEEVHKGEETIHVGGVEIKMTPL